MEKNKALPSLLRKLSRIDSQIMKMIHDPNYLCIPNYSKKVSSLYDMLNGMVEEFAAIGYKFNPNTRKLSELPA